MLMQLHTLLYSPCHACVRTQEVSSSRDHKADILTFSDSGSDASFGGGGGGDGGSVGASGVAGADWLSSTDGSDWAKGGFSDMIGVANGNAFCFISSCGTVAHECLGGL